ncbi:hypothetical protein FOZG_17980 [Fusarium oxysporum Fo47]|uniref:Uncharacterized protein n=1 Tax=Fusarium oxysporum Fo47 TaxID=660027 RepID=W9JF97_FUSOX|nr:hypothetical protein FOZG_17980 [Fusarium oxysporum Fo47]
MSRYRKTTFAVRLVIRKPREEYQIDPTEVWKVSRTKKRSTIIPGKGIGLEEGS